MTTNKFEQYWNLYIGPLVFCVALSVIFAAPAVAENSFADHFDDGKLGLSWDQRNISGDSGVSQDTSKSGKYSMYTNGGEVIVKSGTVDLSSVNSPRFRAWIKSGGSFSDGSDMPENGDDLLIEYKTSSGKWNELKKVEGGSEGQTKNLDIELPSNALHKKFQVRFHQLQGEEFRDYWHIDDVFVGKAGADQTELDELDFGEILSIEKTKDGENGSLRVHAGNDNLVGGELTFDTRGSKDVATGAGVRSITKSATLSVYGHSLEILSLDGTAKSDNSAESGVGVSLLNSGNISISGRVDQNWKAFEQSGNSYVPVPNPVTGVIYVPVTYTISIPTHFSSDLSATSKPKITGGSSIGTGVSLGAGPGQDLEFFTAKIEIQGNVQFIGLDVQAQLDELDDLSAQLEVPVGKGSVIARAVLEAWTYSISEEQTLFTFGPTDLWSWEYTMDNTAQTKPLAKAGDQQSVVEGTTVTLDGSGSSDTDGDSLSYQWDQVSGPAVNLSSPNQEVTDFQAPDIDSESEILQFELIVTDTDGNTSTDTTQVIVENDKEIPENRPPNTPSLASPSDAQTNVFTSGKLSWTGGDPDDEDVDYKVYLGTSSSPSFYKTTESTEMSFQGLQQGKTYYWKVVAVDPELASVESPVHSFTTSDGSGSIALSGLDLSVDLSEWSLTYTPDVTDVNDTQEKNDYDIRLVKDATNVVFGVAGEDNQQDVISGSWDRSIFAKRDSNYDVNVIARHRGSGDVFKTTVTADVNRAADFGSDGPPMPEVSVDQFEVSDRSITEQQPVYLDVDLTNQGAAEAPVIVRWKIDGKTQHVWADKMSDTRTLSRSVQLQPDSRTESIPVSVEVIDARNQSVTKSAEISVRSNNEPVDPSNPNVNGETDVGPQQKLTWSERDADGDQIKYDVYLEKGDETPDKLVARNLTEPSFQPARLEGGETYYWRVVARGPNGGEATSSIWEFTVDQVTVLTALGDQGAGYLQSSGSGPGMDQTSWVQLNWNEYNDQSGQVHPASGDVDGDGKEETVLGLDENGEGWLQVKTDSDKKFENQGWVRVNWREYNSSSGLTRPASGDVDGDGRSEFVIGLSSAGKGWVEVLDDAKTNFRHLDWLQVRWTEYNVHHGETRPAVGDLDGDGLGEIVIGLGGGGKGWMEIVDDAQSNFSHLGWAQVSWGSYNQDSGETWPAAGDVNGDGKDEIVTGLGTAGDGWMEVFAYTAGSLVHLDWLRLNWKRYNTGEGTGETRPVVGNVDDEPDDEIVIGLEGGEDGGEGWIEVKDPHDGSYSSRGWSRIEWGKYNRQNGETWPLILEESGGAKGGEPVWPQVQKDGKNTGVSFSGANISSPTKLWSYSAGDIIRFSPVIGDVDQDGYPDAVFTSLGHVLYVYSGREQKILWSRTIQTSGTVALADVNKDGYPDVITKTGDSGSKISVFSGINGNKIWSNGTSSVNLTYISSGDLTADQIPDVVAAGTSNGRIYAFSGKTGNVIWTTKLSAADYIAGVPAIEDLNSDGIEDVVISTDRNGIFALSGIDGSRMWKVSGGGRPPSIIADLDGDNSPDVILARVTSNLELKLEARSGQNGNLIWSTDLNGDRYPRPGSPAIGDLNEDGIPDAVVAFRNFNGSTTVKATSGKNGSLLWTKKISGEDPRPGPALGDTNSDGILEVLVSGNQSLHALSGTNGSKIWSYPTNGRIEISPALGDMNQDGMFDIVFGNEAGNVHAIDGSK